MQNKIKLTLKSVYGRNLYYPIDELGLLLSRLNRSERRKSSFINRDIEILRKIGYEIEIVRDPISF